MCIRDRTDDGLNLAGVKRVLELEAEVQRLRDELDRARAEAEDAVERTHRRYRHELVPMSSSAVVLYRQRRMPAPD